MKVDPNSRDLHMGVITAGEITRYLRTPTPDYTPPQAATDMARQIVSSGEKGEAQQHAEPHVLPDNKPETMQPENNVNGVHPEVKPPVGSEHTAPSELTRIAIALERIADVLEARFPKIETNVPEINQEDYVYASTVELGSEENRILNDNPNA